MRAIFCDQFGDPARVLRLCDQPDPRPGPGDLLVRMAAASVNPSDLLTVRGTYAQATALPFVPGFEAVGRVVAVGDGVPADWIGRRVLPLRGTGTWAELIASPARWAVPVPDAIPDAVATQCYINPLTIDRLLTRELTLRAGDTVIVTAGASACGRIAAQTARALGLRLIAVVRRDDARDDLLALGATAVVNSAREDLATTVAALTDGRGAAAALDAIGGAESAALVDHIAPGGTLVTYGLLSGSLIPTDLPAAAARGVRVLSFWLKRWVDRCTEDDWHAAFAALMARVESGALTLTATPPLPLSTVAEAMRLAETPGRRSKVVLAG
ncbi:zinc-dependent alcohol dehydrogenase family protein [Azospirillum griseum]|uniref:Alcohol dehydrogenase n=1 Tax=Azospirillum griseum TaxID=2496639 RepID=A0A3S0K1V3_9PROT|nr:zinc-dependent alcohol dehydrogenase family protein [Azospirillum griseum]RTR15857.1 alcohol dehydrogenase [Azospirillum griseum]